MVNEPFVDADTAAEHLGVSRDFILKLARAGEIPAHPLTGGNAKLRRTWRFKIGEIDAAISRK
jgi:excisionase family DNA binding protein